MIVVILKICNTLDIAWIDCFISSPSSSVGINIQVHGLEIRLRLRLAVSIFTSPSEYIGDAMFLPIQDSAGLTCPSLHLDHVVYWTSGSMWAGE